MREYAVVDSCLHEADVAGCKLDCVPDRAPLRWHTVRDDDLGLTAMDGGNVKRLREQSLTMFRLRQLNLNVQLHVLALDGAFTLRNLNRPLKSVFSGNPDVTVPVQESPRS
jgi:hypothetical protein